MMDGANLVVRHPSPAGEGVSHWRSRCFIHVAMFRQRYQTADQKAWRKLKAVARQQRQQATPAEQKLWEVLRLGQFGLRVRRQHAIGQFIADFVFLKPKPIIEVDGEVHDSQVQRDAERDAKLRSMGYCILRFRNSEVLENCGIVVERIGRQIRALNFPARSEQKDSPSPAGKGGGG